MTEKRGQLSYLKPQGIVHVKMCLHLERVSADARWISEVSTEYF